MIFLLLIILNYEKPCAGVSKFLPFSPAREEVAEFKPIQIEPSSSTCGLELKETLCDNRYQDSTQCSNSSSIINCFQICPYGKRFFRD